VGIQVPAPHGLCREFAPSFRLFPLVTLPTREQLNFAGLLESSIQVVAKPPQGLATRIEFPGGVVIRVPEFEEAAAAAFV
jgi:hypothetical protein